MGRSRGDRGSAGVEYIGILLIVALSLVAGTALAPDFRRSVGHATERAARCAASILFDTTCPPADFDRGDDDRDETDETPPSGYPTTGPTIGDGTESDYGLPWPGEWHVGVGNDGPLKGKITVGESMGSCRLDEDGDPYVELSVTNDLRLEGEIDTKHLDLSAFTGRELKYTINTDPDTAGEISEGGDGPQPVDPRTIPVGTAITLDETFYQGTGLTGAYRALQIQLEYKEGQRVSSGIERIDDTHVRINVGDSDVIERTVGLGLGSEDLVAGLNGVSSSEDGKLTSVDVDISTPKGWAAYQYFLSTGNLPRAGSPSISNMTYADFSAWQSKQDLGLKYKDLGLSWTTQDLGGREVTTHNADGTTSYSWVVDWGDDDDVTIVRTAETGVNGETTAKNRSFQLKDVDSNLLWRYLESDTGGNAPDVGEGEDATLTFSDDQLMAMQHAALEQIAYDLELSNNGGDYFGEEITAEEIEDFIEMVPDEDEPTLRDPNILDIAKAETPDDVFDELTDSAHTAEQLLRFLSDFGGDTVAARQEDAQAQPEDYPEDFVGGSITHRPGGC